MSIEGTKRSTTELEHGKIKQAKLGVRSEGLKYKLRHLKRCTTKRTNDEVHSTIVMEPVLTALLDTPQMQRLRDIKQLGTAEHVYMNVNHNRFEHSMGVAHLAERMCRRIQQLQPGLKCTAKDILCVQLAGLMHDIGHGPFSHAFEEFVHTQMEKIGKEGELAKKYESSPDYMHWPTHQERWTHEKASLMMVDAALAHLGLAIDTDNPDLPLKQIGDGVAASSMRAFDAPADEGLLTSRDFIFVKECILGGPIKSYESIFGKEGFHGRKEPYQEWLYDIVSNRHSGLDVDKVDYFARDQRRALRESGEIDKVMVEEAVVAWAPCTDPAGSCSKCRNSEANLHLMLVYPLKMVGATMQFFMKRFSLHSKIYRHKTNDATNYMVKELLSMADPYFKVPAASLCSNVQSKSAYDALPPSRAVLDPGAYLRLRDCIINQIETTTSKELAPARRLVHRIWTRDLYKCVCQQMLRCDKISAHRHVWDMTSDEIAAAICSLQGSHSEATDSRITQDDFIVDKCQVHHGLQDKDPVSRMRFLAKPAMDLLSSENYLDLPKACAVDQSEYESFLPIKLMQHSLRIYSRDSSETKCELLAHQFKQWWSSFCDQVEMTEGPESQQHNLEVNLLTQESDDGVHVLTPPRRNLRDAFPTSITPTANRLNLDSSIPGGGDDFDEL